MNKNKNKKCLIIGRFQPFHNGHLYVVSKCLSDYKQTIIGIGSSQEDYTMKNPMTFGERKEMIEKVLISQKIKKTKFKIVSLPDIITNSQWAKYVAKKAGKFDLVVTASPFTKLLFKDGGYTVYEHILLNRKKYSGTEVRRRMLRNRDWYDLVPSATYAYLKKINISDRVSEISKTDNPYL
mgnify:CR=1 FL=1